ncbi:MAG: ABC transporter permease subunit [Planctomycetes bacterium]|nr:ABC transporter permease subunit [Planctomycetota bacterium]
MSCLAILRAELFRLSRTRAGRIGLVVPALLGALQVVVADFMDAAKLARAAAESGASEALPPSPAFGLFADGLGGLGAMSLVMIALLTGAFSIVRERDQGSFALLVLARSRGSIVVGKALGTCLYLIVAFVALLLATMGTAAIRHDFTAIIEDGYEMASAGDQWLEVARAVGAGLPAILCCACFGVLVSAVTTGVGAAAVGAVVPFTLLALFQSTLGGAAERLFITYAPFFSERAPLTRLSKVARAFSDTHWEQGELARAALVPGVEAIACLALAWLITRRRSA